MNGNYLLDTNIVIALFDKDENVIDNIQKAKTVYIPSIVIGELF
jgi:tRNA(fMet)-specific endonuclease VapC